MIINNLDSLKISFRALYNQAEILLKNGKIIEVALSEKKNKRNNAQNSYYWLFNTWVADFLNESGLSYGEFDLPYTSEIIHEIQKKVFGVATTTKMSIAEFCQYCDKINLFWSEKTCGQFFTPELPIHYLERKGYNISYIYR